LLATAEFASFERRRLRALSGVCCRRRIQLYLLL